MAGIYVNDKYYNVSVMQKFTYREGVIVFANYYRNVRTLEELTKNKGDTKKRYIVIFSPDSDNDVYIPQEVYQTIGEMIGYVNYLIRDIRNVTYSLDKNYHDTYLNLLLLKDNIDTALKENPNHDQYALELEIPDGKNYFTP